MSDGKNILRKFLKENLIESTLGSITNFQEIGEGGCGLVYKCNIDRLEIVCKFLINSSSTKLARFTSEYLNVNLLPSSNLISKLINMESIVIDDQVFPYYLMKKYDCSLVNKRPKSPTIEQLKKLFSFLCASLNFIHCHGVIHRDLKPENILCEGDDYVLADFGIASFAPELFDIHPETKKGERIGNYKFSAPEQTESNTSASVTMDIYALGQICQWFVTGCIHRGTSRERFTTKIENSEIIDSVVDKCLSNNPNERFQSIKEINDYIDVIKKKQKKPDPYRYLQNYGMVMSSSFPKINKKITLIENKNEINRFINNFSNYDFDNYLWWTDGTGSNPVTFKYLNDNIWLMDGYETTINKIWVYFDSLLCKDFALLQLGKMPSFGIYQNVNEYEEAALVDDKFYITRTEFDNAHAEINGEIIKLSEHNVEIRCRYLIDWYVFIITSFHCMNHINAEQYVSDFIKGITTFESCEPSLKLLLKQVGHMKYDDCFYE